MPASYTEEEIILCTYIARFDNKLMSESKISSVRNRSIGSIKMKIQNIVAMLDEKGIERNPSLTALAGMPTGQVGRKTDWEVVSQLCLLDKKDHWKKCKEILIGNS